MQLNKPLEGLAIAPATVHLAACSSSSDSDAAGAGPQHDHFDGMGGVQTGGANGMLSPEEQMRQKFEALQRDNVICFPYDGLRHSGSVRRPAGCPRQLPA